MVAEAAAMFAERQVSGQGGPVAAQHDYKYGDDTTTGRDIRALYHSMVVEAQRARPREKKKRNRSFLGRAWDWAVDRATGLRD